MKTILLLLAIAASMQLSSCTPSLDLVTPRIDSVVVSSVKLRTMSTMIWSGNDAHDTLVTLDWAPVEDTLYFKLKENYDPPRLSLYTKLLNDTTVNNLSAIRLESLTIQFDEIPADGTTELKTRPGTPGSGVYATGKIGGLVFLTNFFPRNFSATATLTYHATPVQRVEGTIIITIQTSDTHRIRIVTAIVGEA